MRRSPVRGGREVVVAGHEEFPSILALLRIPLDAIVQQIQRDLVAAGYADLSPAHFNVLPHLRPGGSRLTDLADAAQVSKQSMGYLVDHLEAHGYVERVLDPSDGRARIIRLTVRGRELSRASQRSLRKVQTRAARRLGESQVQQLRLLLLGLATSLRD